MKTYKYGLLSPITNADKVSDQMWKAHRYQNKLIEIERWRRSEVRALENQAGNMPQLIQAYLTAEETFKQIDQQIKKANGKARSNMATKEQRAQKDQAKKAMKRADKDRKEACKIIRIDESFKAQRDGIYQTECERQAILRKSEEAPWFGTYMLVELAFDLTRRMPLYDGVKPNDPQFRRWNGEGRIGIQQFQPPEPITKVIGDQVSSRYVQIVPYSFTNKKDQTINGEDRKGGKKPLKLLRMRIGTEDDRRTPIWAEFPIIYQRPLPNNGAVAMIQVMRRKIGSREKWEVSITVKEETIEYKPNMRSAIAFDLGWRNFEDRIRVACYTTTDNQKGEIAVPQQLIKQLHKVEELRSTIDQEFDRIRNQLVEWLKSNVAILPDWLKEKTQHLAKWKAPVKLVKVIQYWQEHRFEGDQTIFGTSSRWNRETKTITRGSGLIGWRSHNHHLYQWVSSQSSKARAHLREHYRVLAAQFAEQYDVVVFEDINLAHLARGKVGSTNRQLTAPSEFRNACKNAFLMRGKEYQEVPARNTSKECHHCHYPNEFGANLIYICKGCEKELDRDENAADNILTRYLDNGESEGVQENPVIARSNDPTELETIEPITDSVRVA